VQNALFQTVFFGDFAHWEVYFSVASICNEQSRGCSNRSVIEPLLLLYLDTVKKP